ncbi:acyl-CoA dehydrogenase family protein [Nocardioides terrisoli]|uniref:acyl-CoA dehydrogenase family protein n=1 Tax=Nocardioides terrisoli TaxID=3388267 RepID=UPI00287B77A9|nr:acyl-CoA dehydrogenase family protein [Nocardioides marmorisolisilvae]
MHFARSDEQQELATIVRSLLTKRADSAAVRAAAESDAGYDVALWQALCEQVGVAALPVPEEYDGVGASLVETAIVLEELGRSLAPHPLLSSAVSVARLLLEGTDDERAERLPRIAAGEVPSLTLGTVVLEPAERSPAMDPALRIGVADPAADPTVEIAAVAAALVSAEQVGVMQRGLDMTVGYAGERVQFGRPIGSFQAIKHRLADLLVLLEASRSASWAATYAAAAYLGRPDADHRAVLLERAAVARSYCTDALDRVASETIQLHGGIAITWEHDAHLVFKRAHSLAHLLEPAHVARARLLG